MKKFILLVLLVLSIWFLVVGCDSPAKRIMEDKACTTEETLKKLEGKKILKTTILDRCHIIVTMEDGTTATFYGYTVRNGGDVTKEQVGAR